ncbi:MAG: uracil-DNA glycosylase family protein [Cetobacterium sp.]|uniref:uracil-DNA glycosylase family protein n=1 Tax=unclassified Cetobacterium TaxID=2630983 RepID=UPI00163C42AB|nr:uracil-DNA glycosylase family protein [Cetobacterium sp. 2A]MBC2856443.1 uracil-DNA glycosylase [Cetobacterium sp. 2A]
MEKQALWEELKFEVGSIEGLKDSKEKIILGSGNKEAEVLFVGDDDNLYISEELKVSTGSSGEFLIKLCDIVDLNPDKYYITTLSKSNYKYREVSPEDGRDLKEYLDMQIALINPKVIVALGQEVAEVIFQREVKFLQERGEIQLWKGNIKVLVTYDANFAKQSRDDGGKKSKVAVDFWSDLKVVKKEIENER